MVTLWQKLFFPQKLSYKKVFWFDYLDKITLKAIWTSKQYNRFFNLHVHLKHQNLKQLQGHLATVMGKKETLQVSTLSYYNIRTLHNAKDGQIIKNSQIIALSLM